MREHYRFVTCARLTKFKNIDKILYAIKIIDDPRVRLTVIGKGEEYHFLTQLSNHLGLSNRVEFLETISDSEMIFKLRSSYGLIHAASEEPFGLTPVEAMACGTPVIAMRDGGPAETVLENETGYLAEKAGAEEIAHGMRWLIERRADMDRISSKCVTRAAEFSWERAADSLEKRFASR
jgi:glycosyltransferase involved in cell wall biosynthesis